MTMREIEVRIISAEDVEDVKRFGKMRAYAVAYIDGETSGNGNGNGKACTRVDEDGGINPRWNQILLLRAHHHLLSRPLAALNVDIYARGHVRDKLVGTARILISSLLNSGDNPIDCTAAVVRRPSGRPQGILNVWVPPAGKFLLRRASLSFTRSDHDVDKDIDAPLQFNVEDEGEDEPEIKVEPNRR